MTDRCWKSPGHIRSLAAKIASGELLPQELLRQYLDRIRTVDNDVRAWVIVDAERALQDAEKCAAEAKACQLRGPLHGIPIAVKDIVDVEGLPSGCGSKSRQQSPVASADADVIASLRAAGAIILGKVSTTEFAFFDPPPTRNPHNLEHTPGGSSAGSAAAVASGTVPAAVGTQTFASVNRPAAYCGIASFKPSSRALSTFGVSPLAPYTDTVGFFGWDVDDATFLFEAVCPPYLKRDPALKSHQTRIVFVSDPLLDDVSCDALEATQALAEAAEGIAVVEERASPVSMSNVLASLRDVMHYELARIHRGLLDIPPTLIGERMLDGIQEGLAISYSHYRHARSEIDRARQLFFSTFNDVDAFIWPAAPTHAPPGIETTGDPRCIAPWTALGGPIVTVPSAFASNGLPLGSILAGHPGRDLTTAMIARELRSLG